MSQQLRSGSVRNPSFDYSYVKTPTSIASSEEEYKSWQNDTMMAFSTEQTQDFYIQRLYITHYKNLPLPSFSAPQTLH
jgi:hypothetical protein